MRISDLSSDVCSSDLQCPGQHQSGRPRDHPAQHEHPADIDRAAGPADADHRQPGSGAAALPASVLQSGSFAMSATKKLRLGPLPKTENVKLTFACPASLKAEIGRASCRERVCQYV